MKINVLFSNNGFDELFFTGKTCVVVDVLRASTVVVNALANGAREIIPVGTVDFAMKVSGDAFRSQTLLGGERNTKKVQGFNLGNSPLEYTQEVVNGRSIIHYTTNGSRAIVKAKFSENLYIACFNNLNAVVEQMIKINKDFEIICAGSNGSFNMEDSVCAGKMIYEIQKKSKDIILTDSSNACLIMYKTFSKSILKMLKSTEHGKLLIENGFIDDIKECAKLDTTDIVPYYNSGVIKKLEVNNTA